MADIGKPEVGNFLYYAELSTLIGGVGAALGYYAGAWGVRWLPTMMEIFLAVCMVSFLLIIAGRFTDGSARKVTGEGLKIRRRVLFCIVLASIFIVLQLGVYWTQKPSPLTELSAVEFNEVFENDLQDYRHYDSAMEDLIGRLEECAKDFGGNTERVLTYDEEKMLGDLWAAMYDYAVSLDQIRLFYEDWYRFDPSQTQASYHQRSFLLSFAAELSLFEKSGRFIQVVSEYPNVVKFLDTPFPSKDLPGGSYSKFRLQFLGARDSSRVLAGRGYLKWMEKGLKGKEVARAAGCQWLWDKVEVEFALLGMESGAELAKMSVKSDLQVLKRAAKGIWYPAQKGVANLMGSTRVKRVGKYLITGEQREKMNAELLPGDILFSRKNWYLSNAGLPGFWPHAILYIGSPEKFERYFDDDEIKGWLKELTGEDLTLGGYLAGKYPARWERFLLGNYERPYRVIESVKFGVIFNTLKGACGDYMAALRPRLGKKAKAQAIIEAFRHLDKPYDYDFDFATGHALVCTELVWRSYRKGEGKDGLELGLVEIAGRKTLPANEILRCFAENRGEEGSQFEFVYFIDAVEKDGKAFAAGEEDLVESCERVKWSFAVD